MLRSYCQGDQDGPVQYCSKPVAAYNWAKTPGFSQMLPSYASSANIERLFVALFVLYFIGMIFSFLLWVITLPFSIFFCCSRRLKYANRGFTVFIHIWTTLTFLIMLVALIIAIVLVVGTVKAVSNGSVYWNGHAGISLWFTIASVVSLFLASLCYSLKLCCCGRDSKGYGSNVRIDPATTTAYHGNKHASKNEVFDLTPHNNHVYNTPIMMNQQQQQHQELTSASSLSQQYSPALQPQYLAPIYNQQQPTNFNANYLHP